MIKTVLVPNLPTRWDAATGTRIPSVDLNTAAQHGELKCATQGPIGPDDVETALNDVSAAVTAMNEGDYLLLIGDPICNAAAVAYACDRFGKILVLRWDKQRRSYDKIEVEL
jgi:hypothetical protein